LIRWELNGEHLTRTMILAAIWVMFIVYFVRDNIKLRQQLRRLESMQREWDEPQAPDPDAGR